MCKTQRPEGRHALKAGKVKPAPALARAAHPMDMDVVTLFGIAALAFTMVMYALEERHRAYTLGFAAGCAMGSAYGFAAGVWPFGVVEAIWVAIAVRRFRRAPRVPRVPQSL